MVIPNFVRQALAGQPITVHGDGTQTRSFSHVGDVVDALIRPGGRAEAHRRGLQHRQRRGNLDHGDLAEKVRTLTGSRSTIVTIPYDQAYEAGFEDMPRRVPDSAQDPGAGGL